VRQRIIGRWRNGARHAAPFATLLIGVLALLLVPTVSARSISLVNGYDVFQNFATYGLVALGLGLTMIIGEFDLSVSGMVAVGAMLAVKTGGTHPWLGVVVAVCAGLAVGSVQGALVAFLRINSMSVTVGGYVVLLGLTNVIGHESSVGYSNYGVSEALDRSVLSIFSIQSLVVLAAMLVVGAILSLTRWGRDIRAVGGDRRASRVSGVRVDRVVVLVFACSGGFSALAGALLAYSLATATPDLASLETLIFAATAALLGGVGLAGGRGGILGLIAGVLSLSLLQEILATTAAPEYLSQIITGSLLLITSALAAPEIGRWWKSLRQSSRPYPESKALRRG
jgi:ribose/xylose/arabinose/galactoside ABC-type transport system permease subunit